MCVFFSFFAIVSFSFLLYKISGKFLFSLSEAFFWLLIFHMYLVCFFIGLLGYIQMGLSFVFCFFLSLHSLNFFYIFINIAVLKLFSIINDGSCVGIDFWIYLK